MFVRDMDNELFNEVPSRNSFGNKQIIFVSIVMKGNIITIVVINARRSNNRSAKITANIFKHRFAVG